ncbi:MAG: hypothetical protein U9Q71_04725 [Pseudomonadota bacterium]|nr:hypothetical protein [Pseudomonadota bacterium]
MREKIEQIRQMHARYIHSVVAACQNEEAKRAIEPLLQNAMQQGWDDLVRVSRLIIQGKRDTGLLERLDEEDRAIASGILEGLRNPAALPDADVQPEARDAAPGLASIIAAASRGDAQALQALSAMGEQMTAAGGKMAELAGVFRRLVNGERDADRLAEKMGIKSSGLLLSILEELAKLDRH